MHGTMLWFNEVKDHGFIATDEGERLYVDGDGFAAGEKPVGRCAGKPVSFEVEEGEGEGERRAVGARLVTMIDPPRARRRHGNRIST
jgi:cold shock CspA family protein